PRQLLRNQRLHPRRRQDRAVDRQHHRRRGLLKPRAAVDPGRRRAADRIDAMTRTLLRRLARFLRDHRGAAAVELALVSPFLAVVVAGIATYAPELDKVHKMREGVAMGALYVMEGNTDATNIQTVALNAWTGHSGSDAITVNQWCECSGTTNSCTSLCSD